LKRLKVVLKSIIYYEEHGLMIKHNPGETMLVPARTAQEWQDKGDAIIVQTSSQAKKVVKQVEQQNQIDLSLIKIQPRQVQKSTADIQTYADKNLVEKARQFWYNNESDFMLRGNNVTREKVAIYGGPSRDFPRCQTCIESEWLSRLTQSNQFKPHSGCPTSGECEQRCEKQGDDRYTQCHQDFSFSIGCDSGLDAPRCVRVLSDRWYRNYTQKGGSHVTLNKRRALAQAAQVDVFKLSEWNSIDFSKYDFLYMNNSRTMPLLPRPNIPILMYGHDHWKGNPQETLDHYKPDFFITPFFTCWQRNMRIPENTQVELYAISASNFFTRPNLDKPKKSLDLLCIGAMSKGPTGPYGPRLILHDQIKSLSKKYKVEHSHKAQFGFAKHDQPLSATNTFLNAYSEHLGRAKFVIFAPCQGQAKDALLIKYYEVLGCGAIPIMPIIPDLAKLGIEPNIHYLPFKRVQDDMRKLALYLDQYDRHFHIAQNAVRWHQENADTLLFDRFEDIVRKLTNEKYPQRVK